MSTVIKIILSILLLICLLEMPYGYYQLVRFIAMMVFASLAIEANNKGMQNYMLLYIGLAILFQPFLKIALGREVWNVVDVIVALFLIITTLVKRPVEKA